jgi:hypothetical protein
MPRVRLPSAAAAAPAAGSSGNTTDDEAWLEWVEWVDEPRHELLFENDYTRIYRARFDAGAACETLYHRHGADTVYACVSDEAAGGVVLNTEVELDANGTPVAVRPPERVSFKAGLCFCHLNRTRGPRIHRIQTGAYVFLGCVWVFLVVYRRANPITHPSNQTPQFQSHYAIPLPPYTTHAAASNAGTLEFIGAEVLARPPVVAPAPLATQGIPYYKVEPCDHPRARCYRVKVPPGASTGPVEWAFSGVVVVLSGAPRAEAFAQHGTLKAGSAFWFEGPIVVDVTAAAAAAAAVEGDGSGQAAAAELLVVEWC